MNPEELLAARCKLGLSQREMGGAIGLSREAISSMERGKRPIELRTVLAIRYRIIQAGRRAVSRQTK